MADSLSPLPRAFYDRDVCTVARDVLGKRLVRQIGGRRVIGRIVEVEAYVAGDDPANHAWRGRTKRNASMFGPPGHAYVYTIHTHHCLNFVTEPAGVASAVLIRAVEPIDGIELMKRRRGVDDARLLCSGPGRLCQAFDIDRSLDGWDLVRGARIWVADGIQRPAEVVTSGRIGVSAAAERPLRFFIPDNPFVSRFRRAAGKPA